MRSIEFAVIMILGSVGVAWAGSITGYVQTPAMLLPGVSVRAYAVDSYTPAAETNTDSNGFYVLDGLAEGAYLVEAGASAPYIGMYYDHTYRQRAASIWVYADEQTGGISFFLDEGVTLRGRVVDPAGQPIANVSVRVRHDYAYTVASATTDATGHFEVTGLLSQQAYLLTLVPPAGSPYAMTALTRNAALPKTYELGDITLADEAFTVSGTTRYHQGDQPAPYQSVLVQFHWNDPLRQAWTVTSSDAAGNFSVANLPAGPLSLTVLTAGGYFVPMVELDLQSDVTDAALLLFEGTTVSGRLIDSETAAPIPNVWIDLGSERFDAWQGTSTDADGRFWFQGVPPGLCELSAHPDVSSGYAPLSSDQGGYGVIEEGQDIDDCWFALSKGALVTGRVVDANGAPMANVEVDIQGLDYEYEVYTDNQGAFAGRVPPGSYYIKLEWLRDLDVPVNGVFQQVDIVDLTPVDLPAITAYIPGTGDFIAGTVVKGNSVANTGVLEVVVLDADRDSDFDNLGIEPGMGYGELNVFGQFTADALAPGVYDLYLVQWLEDADELESSTVLSYALDVPLGTTNVVLSNAPGEVTVTGRVVDAEGVPVLRAWVLLLDESAPQHPRVVALADGDVNGEFVLYNLRPGTYTRLVLHPKYVAQSGPVTLDSTAVQDWGDLGLNLTGQAWAVDLTGDGLVNLADAAALSSQWLTGGPTGDYDQNGVVDPADLARWAGFWLTPEFWRAR